MAENSVQILSTANAIRTRPGMYIGSKETPEHLVHELIDNAYDEISKGYASKMSLSMMAFKNVVFPAPFLPIIAILSFSFISKLISSNIVSAP